MTDQEEDVEKATQNLIYALHRNHSQGYGSWTWWYSQTTRRRSRNLEGHNIKRVLRSRPVKTNLPISKTTDKKLTRATNLKVKTKVEAVGIKGSLVLRVKYAKQERQSER
jgi:hypothetical protein